MDNLFVSAFLGVVALITAYKAIKDYLKYLKDKKIEELAAAAVEKVLKRLDALEEENHKIKEKLATHDGVIDALFRMRKE